ncbi:MAG: prolyl-tRNA synthetase associated domain-containing protein [Defluviicoccus sp.]|nr:prolyl-tRNA synthetase associated domain-containing protein [Defluviicoccus sp.]
MTEAVSPETVAARRRVLFERLEELGIVTETQTHAPVFTVEESRRVRGRLPGAHCKSLFLKDKKGALWLVVALEDRRLDLKALAPLIGSARLSFGSPERLAAHLGVVPGAVTPFALINDDERAVRPVIDSGVMRSERAHFHPLSNDATTAIAPSDLLRFVRALGHDPAVVDLGEAAAE